MMQARQGKQVSRGAFIRVLMVEDSEDDAVLLQRQLENGGYGVEMVRVDSRAALVAALKRGSWDIVFSDFSMPQFDGMQALHVVREHDEDLPFIVVSGTIGEERAVQLMKLGAQDYVIKGNSQRLIPAVERELREAKLRREHRLAQDHIQRLAYYDSLTQLPNRHRLIETMQSQLNQAKPLALAIVNMVDFREINETLGYSKGDELIREVAARLEQLAFDQATLYHLHGNEFAFLLPTHDRRQGEALAQSVLRAFGRHHLSAGFRIHVGARIGLAVSRMPEANTLLQQAGMAVSLAKRLGKPYAWYEVARDPSSPQSLALLADLHDAVGTDQLFLVYQPKVQCSTGTFTGGEALLRWRHPEHGMISPDTFIHMAEKSGLIDDIARHVAASVGAQVRAWQEGGMLLPVAMNLSAKNLLDARLMTEILDNIRRSTDPTRVEIEITETALMRDPDQSLSVLRQLYEAGVRIYIDDFGTGFSSLGYLKKLPIHSIKIDKSFVLDLVNNADSDTIVRSTISLAHNLNLKVVAEGVESREVLDRLRSYGCDEAQGHYFAKPLTADEFERKVRAGK